eukprot:TRINITY_DN6569_c0_g1_i1.p1 TRINITY_DN6569_c0_g1~~TRINITY_DN6569_c0_g1_i1.p1  ORF type:complete len:422 (+),score=74.17 TRINITY_DN6569_c0_g1_i1:358-1623(+)
MIVNEAKSRSAQLVEEFNESWVVRSIQGASKLLHGVSRVERFGAGSTLKLSTLQGSTRLAWALRNLPQVQSLLKEDKLVFGTIDTWILWNLTAGKVHATDYGNVCGSGLWDPFINNWNQIVLKLLGIPLQILPKIVDTSGYIADIEPSVFGNENRIAIPITCVSADSHASLFGECCFRPGDTKCTMGTGNFIAINTGSSPFYSKNGLYPFIAWKIGSEITYMIEGSGKNGGSVIDWAQQIGLIQNVQESSTIAESVADTNGVFFGPGLSGLGNPHTDDTARGLLIGMNRDTTRQHLVRAILESLAFNVREMVDCIQEDLPQFPMEALHVDGGVTNNPFIMQFCADLLEMDIRKAAQIEMSNLGAAFMAGLAVKLWQREDLIRLRGPPQLFKPSLNEQQIETLHQKYCKWQEAIQRSLKWQS